MTSEYEVTRSLLMDKDEKIYGLYYGRATSWIGPYRDGQRLTIAGLAMTIPELVKGPNHRMTANAPVTMSLPTEVPKKG